MLILDDATDRDNISCAADLNVNWAGRDLEAWRGILEAGGGTPVAAVLHKHGLPKRLCEAICQEADIEGVAAAQLKKVWHACGAGHAPSDACHMQARSSWTLCTWHVARRCQSLLHM